MKDSAPTPIIEDCYELTEVRCNNAAIHIDARNITLTHRKAFRILIHNAWDEIHKCKPHYINASKLAHMLGFHDLPRLKTELEKMPFVKVEWNILRDDGWPIDVGVCGLISGFRLVGNQFKYSFFEDFRPFLKNPKVWSHVKIEVANLFNSEYALNLYETCNRFVDVRSTGLIELTEWRKMLGIPESDYYSQWGVVNKKILKPAIAQVNRLADITIAPKFKRIAEGGRGVGRTYTHMAFEIEKKKNYRLPSRQLTLPLKKETLAQEIEAFCTPVPKPITEATAKAIEEKGVPLFIRFPERPSLELNTTLKSMGFSTQLDTDKQWFWRGTGSMAEIAALVKAEGGKIQPALAGVEFPKPL